MRGRRGGCLKGRGEKGPRGMAGEDTAKGSGAAPPRPRLSLAHSAGSVFSLKRCRPRGRWAHGAGRVGKSRILTRTVHALGENTDCRGCWPGLACVRGAPVAIREGTLPRTWALLMPPALSWQTGGLGRGRQGSSRDRPDTASGHFSQCVLASRGWDGGGWGLCSLTPMRGRRCWLLLGSRPEHTRPFSAASVGSVGSLPAQASGHSDCFCGFRNKNSL